MQGSLYEIIILRFTCFHATFSFVQYIEVRAINIQEIESIVVVVFFRGNRFSLLPPPKIKIALPFLCISLFYVGVR